MLRYSYICDMIFTIKHKVYVVSGSALPPTPPPPQEKFGGGRSSCV